MAPRCKSGVATGGRKNLGRQKVVLKLIENESNRQVTFSKRKVGLFKKAGQLCRMPEGDVEVAVLVLSTKGKPYSFGHPSVNAVIDRYRNGGVRAEPVYPVSSNDSNDAEDGGARDMWWWEVAVEGMAEEELRRYREFLEKLKVKVTTIMHERVMNMKMKEGLSSSSLLFD